MKHLNWNFFSSTLWRSVFSREEALASGEIFFSPGGRVRKLYGKYTCKGCGHQKLEGEFALLAIRIKKKKKYEIKVAPHAWRSPTLRFWHCQGLRDKPDPLTRESFRFSLANSLFTTSPQGPTVVRPLFRGRRTSLFQQELTLLACTALSSSKPPPPSLYPLYG